jgi:2-polyprenyl-3-methyl-5-hydroxy-6-metoxy-1,4-benzoquinol methylase
MDFYKTLYRKFLSGKSEPTEKYFEKQYNRGINIINFLLKSKVLDEKDKNLFIFEVGCGAGGILKAFKDRGFVIQGCDLDATYLNYGRDKYNLNLNHGTLNQIRFERPPDIVIYSHVLEHILHPKEEISQIYNILNENGYLYIEVPGVKNILKSHDMNFLHFLHYHHVYHFTLISLKNLLHLNGYRLINGNNFIRSVFKKSTSKKSYEILNDYKEVINFLKKIEKRRKFLLIHKLVKLSINYLKSTRNLGNISFKNQIKYLLLGYLKQIRFFKRFIYKLIK